MTGHRSKVNEQPHNHQNCNNQHALPIIITKRLEIVVLFLEIDECCDGASLVCQSHIHDNTNYPQGSTQQLPFSALQS